MKIYKAYIGRSSYEIPYENSEDLQELQEICKEANSLINTIASQDKTSTQEFALVLALVNLIYENTNLKLNENKESLKPQNNSQNVKDSNVAKKYSQHDVLQIIEYMRSKIKC
jgi:hypothetical protein